MKLVEQLAFTAEIVNQNSAKPFCFSTPIAFLPQFCHHELWQVPHHTEHQAGLETSRMLDYYFLPFATNPDNFLFGFWQIWHQPSENLNIWFGALVLLQFVQSATWLALCHRLDLLNVKDTCLTFKSKNFAVFPKLSLPPVSLAHFLVQTLPGSYWILGLILILLSSHLPLGSNAQTYQTYHKNLLLTSSMYTESTSSSTALHLHCPLSELCLPA